jgi:hypothetical protein
VSSGVSLRGNVSGEDAEIHELLRLHIGKVQRTAEPLFQSAEELDEPERESMTPPVRRSKLSGHRLSVETNDGQRLEQ